MKKLAFTLSLTILLITLSGCGGKSQEEEALEKLNSFLGDTKTITDKITEEVDNTIKENADKNINEENSNEEDNSDNEGSDGFDQKKYEDCFKGCEMLKMFADKEGVDEKLGCEGLCKGSQYLESKNIEDCDKIEEKYSMVTRSLCIQSKASDQKKPERCEKLPEDGDKELFGNKDLCYSMVAGSTKDITLCGKIKNSFYKMACEEGIKDSE